MYAAFNINGKDYRTYFAPIKSIKDTAFTVDFEYRPPGADDPYDDDAEPRLDITGMGDEFRVFATVGVITKEFIEKQKPKELHFTADEPSREALYTRLTKRLASVTGYKVKKADSGIYILAKG